MKTVDSLIINQWLAKTHFAPILPLNLDDTDTLYIDLSENNAICEAIHKWGSTMMEKWLNKQLQFTHKKAHIGGYLEKRKLYQKYDHFTNELEPREFHLGVDIWTQAETPVFAPMEGTVHSFQDNNRPGDYGPTIILEHQIKDFIFYTLYGHLSRISLQDKYVGQKIKAGEQLATIGNYPENGDWAPHLHFQIILDIQDYKGDFPGVCSAKTLQFYKKICPNPNLILKSPILD